MKIFNIILKVFLFLQALQVIDGAIVSTHINKRLNETEWNGYLRKSFKCLDQTLCATYCMKEMVCNLVEYESTASRCKQYYRKFGNEISLKDSANTNVLKMSAYGMRGILLKSFTPDTSYWTSCFTLLQNGNLVTGLSNGYIKVWNLTSSSNWLSFIATRYAHNSQVCSLLEIDNGQLVTSGFDESIMIWNTKDWSLKRMLSGHTNSVFSLALFSNGNLVSGSADMTFKVWNPNDGSLISSLEIGQQIWPLIVLDNQDVVTGGFDDYNIKIWNHFELSLKATLSGHTNALSTLFELNNGDLASGAFSEDKIIIWDMTTYTIKRTLDGHTQGISHLIQLENGDLASASSDNSIKIWDLNDWTCKNTLTGHELGVYFLIELPNGFLASSSTDKKIIIWI